MNLEILKDISHGNLKETIIDMKKLQSDKNLTKQIRIDTGLHRLLKMKASELSISIKTLLEGYIAEGLKEETSKNSP